jgi:hypothetical protein
VTRIPLEEWFGSGGLSIISFPAEAEYAVLNQMLDSLGEERMALIHSKPIHLDSKEYVTLIDATNHAPTARTTLRRRVGEYDNTTLLENPADVQGVLNQLGKIAGLVQVKWWLWWSPSDMVAQGLTDEEVARCMRVIAKDFSETRFLGLVAKDVHTLRGLATLKYVSSIFIDVTRRVVEKHSVHNWSIVKHPHTELEGDEIEIQG